jgi:hypothetical protein
MDDLAAKEMRQALRNVQEHLAQAHLTLGAQRETTGLVDVVHHPTSKLPNLNYVTPRKSTAWISGKEVQQGLDQLRKLGRIPRVHYIEGLFPPMFAKTLHGLGLRVEQETPIMLYHPSQTPLPKRSVPDSVTLVPVKDQRGSELWWYIWRNAYYEVLTTGIEPLFVGRDMREIMMGRQIDIIAYSHGFPAGVVRVTIQNNTAHITALALMKELRTPDMTHLLQIEAIKAAVERECTLVFAPGETERDRRQYRELGFVDSGSIVCYAERTSSTHEESHDTLAQPVLVLR